MLILVLAGLLGRAYAGLALVAVLGLTTAVQRMAWTMPRLDAQP